MLSLVFQYKYKKHLNQNIFIGGGGVIKYELVFAQNIPKKISQLGQNKKNLVLTEYFEDIVLVLSRNTLILVSVRVSSRVASPVNIHVL